MMQLPAREMVKSAPEQTDFVTGLRWGKSVIDEQRRYDFSTVGNLAEIPTFIEDYLAGVVQLAGLPVPSLAPQGLSINASRQGLTLDSSWLVDGLQVGLPLPVTGEIRLRIVAMGNAVGVKPPKKTLAANYNRIKDYAIGVSFKVDNESVSALFDTDMIIQYRSVNQKYSLKSLAAQPLNRLLDPSQVVGISAEGGLRNLLAGAVDLADPSKLIDRAAFPFAVDFPLGWHTPAAGWLA
jgi:hypothetical protein